MLKREPQTQELRQSGEKCRAGVTLLELLVTTAVIAILVALLLPAVQHSRETARRISCRDRLRQLGIALQVHHNQHQEFPPGSLNEWSWNARLLPHLEQSSTYQQFDLELEPFDFPNTQHVGQQISVLLCPSDPYSDSTHAADWLGGTRFGHTNFVGSIDAGSSRGMFGYSTSTRIADVTDGTSQTIFVGERGIVHDGSDTHGWWSWGAEAIISPQQQFEPGRYDDPTCLQHWWSYHPLGSNFLFVDGSARQLAYTIDRDLLAGLASKDGGEVVNF